MRQEDWLDFRRNGDLYEKDDFMPTVIIKSLSFIVPLSYFLVPLGKYRTETHELVSAVCLTRSLLVHARGVIPLVQPPPWNSRSFVAGQVPRTDFDDLEDELLKWATEWDEGDDVVYAAAKASMKKMWSILCNIFVY